MNLIFLTQSRISDVNIRGIYTDLMRKFRDEGHNVYIVYPRERQFHLSTSLYSDSGVHILGVKTLNLQKTNVVEKGIGTLLFEYEFTAAIKKYLKNVKFDLILYSTPPVTFIKVIKYLKRKNPSALTYLLLKDIFPQNAVDIGMLSKSNPIYKYFRKKEIRLYNISDYIGCMSPANVEYILKHNDIPNRKVEVNPNSIEVVSQDITNAERNEIRKKYGLPLDRPIFIYGGNLGKPQGIDFLIQCLQANINRTDCYFLIVGSGTEYGKLIKWMHEYKPNNILLHERLPKIDYDSLVKACDVGLIFLNCRFTIPNYPSRLLSYLENKMPILAATDSNTDIGKIAEINGFGKWCRSDDVLNFTQCLNGFISNPDLSRKQGELGYKFLLDNYLVMHTYKNIMKHMR